MFNNKKGIGIGVFGFFFVLMIFSSLFLFFTFGMHYLLYDYAIEIVKDDVAGSVLDAGGESMTNINNLAVSYLAMNNFFDILFLVLIVSAFIESTIASLKAREEGFLSFFGFVTFGNLFLIFILSYASQIQGWIMNEIIYNVILVDVASPILTGFFNYSIYIGLFWYLWLLGINQINFEGFKERIPNILSREKLTSNEGRFENE